MTRTRTSDSDLETALQVRNPATGDLVQEVPLLGGEEVGELTERARRAQQDWASHSIGERAAIVQRFRRRLLRHRALLIETLQSETAKPWEDCNADVVLTATWADQSAHRAPTWLADEQVDSQGGFSLRRRSTIQHEPVGVVGVIGPWNAPLCLTIGDAIPALLAGNTVVCKPSELTPLGVSLAARMWLEAGGPPDVLLVATGDGDTGAALVDRVDHVHFTGSVATGRKVAVRAAERLVGCSLELGGKDAMIVLADADLDRAAAACVHNALFNTGQLCISIERVYVDERVHDAFVDRVTARVRQLHQGVPSGPGTADVSTFIDPAQLDVVRSHVADAVERGARVVVGGRTTSGPATFHQPTVLVDVDHSMRCMTEETFGPTIPIMRVSGGEEAVALANDSDYGLAASVWTSDVEHGESLARRLEAGTVTVNDATFHLGDAELPMHGWKSSGLGGRNGRAGMLRFTRTRVVQVASTIGAADPAWMPYAPRRSRLVADLYVRALDLPRVPRLPTPRRVLRGVRRVLGSDA